MDFRDGTRGGPGCSATVGGRKAVEACSHSIGRERKGSREQEGSSLFDCVACCALMDFRDGTHETYLFGR